MNEVISKEEYNNSHKYDPFPNLHLYKHGEVIRSVTAVVDVRTVSLTRQEFLQLMKNLKAKG